MTELDKEKDKNITAEELRTRTWDFNESHVLGSYCGVVIHANMWMVESKKIDVLTIAGCNLEEMWVKCIVYKKRPSPESFGWIPEVDAEGKPKHQRVPFDGELVIFDTSGIERARFAPGE